MIQHAEYRLGYNSLRRFPHMASGSNTVDTPVTKPQFTPGDANQLPTKTYPSSTGMATKGSSNTIDSPAPAGPYTKNK